MASDLSQEDLDYIDSMFDMMDINQDGSISLKELTKAMKAQGNKPKNQEIRKMLEEADTDGDGEIDWSEFLTMTKNRMKIGKQPKPEQPKEKEMKVDRKGFRPQKPQINVDPPKNVLDTQKKTEILKMFNRMDPNGNGFVEFDEFEAYLSSQGTHLGKERLKQLYTSIRDSTTLDTSNEQSGITFQDMIKYFENEEILDDNIDIEIDDSKIEAIDDIAEYFALANLTNSQLDGSSMTSLAKGVSRKNTIKDTMKDLVSKKSLKTEKLEDASKKRWKPFASFKRRVDRKTVMSSPSGIIRDFLPGNYSASDLVSFDDLPPIKPVSTIVDGVKWIEGGEGKPSKLIFPDNFNGEIETDIATSETLKYYGAFLAETSAKNFSLDERHVLQDFTYGNDYFETWVLKGAGGAALEYHNFSHLDCPLTPMKKSGYFVIAKWLNDSRTKIEITAFQVPTQHTIYTPGGIMHTNNYLKGTWRTMLADGPINEGKLEKGGQPFKFAFKG